MARRPLSTAIAAGCLALAAAAGAAQADTGDIIAPQNTPRTANDGWQAGTCTIDTAHAAPRARHPAQFYTQAAGHPLFGFTQFIVKDEDGRAFETPVGVLKDVRVDLPVGLSVNPQATPQCPLATFTESAALCAALGGRRKRDHPLARRRGRCRRRRRSPRSRSTTSSRPRANRRSSASNAAGQNVFLKVRRRLERRLPRGLHDRRARHRRSGTILKNRLDFNGLAGNGTFLTNPSTCHDPAQAPFQHIYSTFLRADSVEAPNPKFPEGSTSFEAPLPPGVKPTGCDQVPFKPAIAVTPGHQADRLARRRLGRGRRSRSTRRRRSPTRT